MNDPDQIQPFRHPALPRGVRWATRLLVCLPLLAFAVAAGLSLARVGRLLLANLTPVAAGEISRQIGHEVRLGHVGYTRLGVLTIDRAAVSRLDTFRRSHGQSALTAERIIVHYDLHSLLFDSGNAAHALGDIVLERPDILVERYADSRYNFSDLLTPKDNKKHKPFDGQVIIHSGTLHFRDYLAPARMGVRPAFNSLAGIDAHVSFHSERYVYFDGVGRGVGGRLGGLGLRGDASRLTAGRYRVDAQIADADAAYWTDYFKAFPQARVTGGRADVDVSVSKLASKPSPGLPLDLLGRVQVRHVTVAVADRRFLRRPIQDITGEISFTGGGAGYDGTLRLGGQQITAKGTLFNFQHPQVAVSLDSPRLDPRGLAAALPALAVPAGVQIVPGPVVADITGTLAAPVISGDVHFPAVSYAGNQARDVRARAVVVGKSVSIPAVTFALAGGQGSLRLTLDTATKTPRILLGGRLHHLDLAGLRLPSAAQKAAAGLGGIAEIAFAGDNHGHPLSLAANVSVADPRFRQTRLRSLRGRVTWSGAHGLMVDRLLAEDKSGYAAVSGAVPLGPSRAPWNLTVAAAGADVARLLGPYTRSPVGGVAYFQGTVTGSRAAPHASGRLHLVGAHYGRFTADTVAGSFDADKDRIRLSGVVVRRFPVQAQVSGTITRLTSRDPDLGLSVHLEPGDLQDLLALAREAAPAAGRAAPPPALTGTAQADMQIAGRLSAPRLTGQASLHDATFGAYRVDQARADLAYSDGQLRVDNGVVRAEGATMTVRGRWAPRSGQLAAIFSGDHLDLANFRRQTRSFADVTGLVDFSGAVGGTLRSPTATVGIVARNVTLDGQTLAPVTAFGRYADGVFTKTGDPWQIVLQPSVEDGPQPVRYVVDSLRLTLPTPAHPRQPSTLRLLAHVPADAPERLAHLVGTLRRSRFAGTPAGQALASRIDLLPRPLGGTLAIPSLAVEQQGKSLSVRAHVQAGGLRVGDNQIGQIAADLDYTRAGAAPGQFEARANAQAQDLHLAGVPVSRLAVDNLVYTGRHISVDQVRAMNQRAFLQASGQADLDGEITATLDASNVPLSLFDAFLPPSQSLGGEISTLSARASGQTRSPDLNGSVDLADPSVARVQSANLAPKTSGASLQERTAETVYALSRIRSGEITLASPTAALAKAGVKVLSVSDLSAFKDGRLIATASGSVPFRWGGQTGPAPSLPGPPTQAHLQVADLSLLSLFLPALDPKKTSGTLTATVNTDQAPGGPIAGTLEITNGAVGVASVDTAFQNINGRIVVGNNRVVVQTLRGQSNKGGQFSVAGSADLASRGLDLILGLKNLQVMEVSKQNFLVRNYNSDVRGKINGTIAIRGAWRTPRLTTPPGQPLRVTEASATLPSAAPAAGPAAAPPPLDPRFDLEVTFGGGGKTVSVHNALLQASAEGQLTLQGRLTDPLLRAHLNVYKGQFILPPSTRLRFIPPVGSVDLSYPVTGTAASDAAGQPILEKRVDLTAQASVSISPAALAASASVVSNEVQGEAAPGSTGPAFPVGSSLGRPRRYVITAHIFGVLDDPDHLQIDLSSSPGGLTHQQMLVALSGESALQPLFGGGTGAEAALKQQFAQTIGSIAIPTLLDPLEAGVASAFGLSSFTVDYSLDQGTLVSLSKDLAPRLEITYERSVGSRTPGAVSSVLAPPQYLLKLGYALTDRLQLSASTDDQRDNGLALEGVIRF